MRSPRKSLVASAIMLACTAGPAAAQFSNLYFFGDSLTDAGSYAPALPPGLGRFTTNPDPVWAQVLGERYGFTITPANQGGTDHAQGGARITGTPGVPAQPPTGNALPIATQVAQQVGAGIDSRALYSLWGGANDIFYQLGLVQAGQITAAQAQANVVTAAQQYVAQVATLQAAGARNIVVFNLPDIGKTPGFAGNAAQLTAISNLYNSTVQSGLDALGGNVIRVDVTALLNDVTANPGRYGFANTTGTACVGVPSALVCGPENRVAPDANRTYVFADGVHPTGAAHVVIAGTVVSMLEGPRSVATLAEGPLAVESAAFRAVDARMWSGLDTPRAPRRTNLWASLDYANPDIGMSGIRGDADLTTLSVGIDYRVSDHLVAGAAGNFSKYDASYTGGSHELEEASGSIYAGFGNGPWYGGVVVLIGSLDYKDITRDFNLGLASTNEEGSTNGTHWSIRALGGYWLKHGDIRHGPFASFVYQEAEVDAFSERAGSFTALRYNEQTRKSAVGGIGWQAAGQWGAVRPFGRVTWEFETKDDERTITATTVGGGSYEVTMGKPDSNWALFTFGASMDVTAGSAAVGPVSAYVMGTATAGKSDNDSWSVTLGIRAPL